MEYLLYNSTIRSLVWWIVVIGCKLCITILVKNGSIYTVDLCDVQLEQIKILIKHLVRASKEPWKYESIHHIKCFVMYFCVHVHRR